MLPAAALMKTRRHPTVLGLWLKLLKLAPWYTCVCGQNKAHGCRHFEMLSVPYLTAKFHIWARLKAPHIRTIIGDNVTNLL